MIFEKEFEFVKNVLDNCNVQNFLIDPEEDLTKKIDERLIKIFNINSAAESFVSVFSKLENNTVYRLFDVLACRFIFLRLPTFEKENIFIVGPYLSKEMLEKDFIERCEALGIAAGNVGELKSFYISLPVIKDENILLAVINTFSQKIWGSKNFNNVELNKNDVFFLGEVKLKDTPDILQSIDEIEKRYEFESELIVAISQGNISKIENFNANISPLVFESRTSDQLRNIKNYCIIMNTLCRKAAQQGGIHPIYIDSVSSGFAKKIEMLSSVEETTKLMHEIMISYCRLVRRNSIKNYSPLVQRAIIKIENDLTADLSLKEIAKLNNVSCAYFSDLFKKETGQTLTKYVNTKRIDYAKYLLKNSSLQIQTIAQHSGILDLHYFCRVFKALTGVSPSEYRQKISFN